MEGEESEVFPAPIFPFHPTFSHKVNAYLFINLFISLLFF